MKSQLKMDSSSVASKKPSGGNSCFSHRWPTTTIVTAYDNVRALNNFEIVCSMFWKICEPLTKFGVDDSTALNRLPARQRQVNHLVHKLYLPDWHCLEKDTKSTSFTKPLLSDIHKTMHRDKDQTPYSPLPGKCTNELRSKFRTAAECDQCIPGLHGSQFSPAM